jgi:hypothetical protein
MVLLIVNYYNRTKAAFNKLSLLLIIISQNTQLLQLFTICFCFILIVNSCKYYNYLQSILKQIFLQKLLKCHAGMLGLRGLKLF